MTKLLVVLAALAASVASVSAGLPCDTYATTATTQYNLVQSIVTRAIVGNTTANPQLVGLIGAGTSTLPFFNNANPTYRSTYMNGANAGNATLPDYTAGGAPLTALIDHLTTFFGGALNCAAMASYDGKADQSKIHENMPITLTVFTAFATQVGDSAASYGMSTADVNTVASALTAYQRSTPSSMMNICNDLSCPCAAGYSGANCAATPTSSSTGHSGAASAVGVSVASTLMAAAAAVFAMRR